MSTPVPLLDLKAQYDSIRGEVDAAMARVVESQHFILGPEVEALEKSIAEYSGCEHGIGLSSGTDAILSSPPWRGSQPRDEVITTPYTFVATATCIARLGARAVSVDIDPKSFNVDPSRIEAAITPRTKAIVPVHLYGQMADTAAIAEIAARRGIPVVEDAAQAIGAEENGRRADRSARSGASRSFRRRTSAASVTVAWSS